jgi:hypothetical protein
VQSYLPTAYFRTPQRLLSFTENGSRDDHGVIDHLGLLWSIQKLRGGCQGLGTLYRIAYCSCGLKTLRGDVENFLCGYKRRPGCIFLTGCLAHSDLMELPAYERKGVGALYRRSNRLTELDRVSQRLNLLMLR